MCRRSSQLKIKLIFNTRKGYYTNQFLLKRLQANFNFQFVYAVLKYASQPGFVIGHTWKCKLHNEYPSIKKTNHVTNFFRVTQSRVVGPKVIKYSKNKQAA